MARRSGEILAAASLVAAFAGLFAAGTLSVGHLLDLPLLCGTSRGCDAIAAHPSSRILGIPIALGGVGFFLVLLFLIPRESSWNWATWGSIGVAAAGTAAGGALLAYSQTAIGATCSWCVAAGAAAAASLALALARVVWPPPSPPAAAWYWALGLACSAAIGLQAGLMRREALRPPVPPERLAGLSAAELVDPAKALGPEGAPMTVVMFADLACPACRAAHEALLRYRREAGDRVRLAFRHLPLQGIRGHELSGAASALAEIAGERGRLWPFLDAVYGLERAPDRAGYLQIVRSLGIDPVEAEQRIANADDPAVERVWCDMHLAQRLGIAATPTFVVLRLGRPPISANLRTLPTILNERP
jgi:uncharacterized membrane protein